METTVIIGLFSGCIGLGAIAMYLYNKNKSFKKELFESSERVQDLEMIVSALQAEVDSSRYSMNGHIEHKKKVTSKPKSKTKKVTTTPTAIVTTKKRGRKPSKA